MNEQQVTNKPARVIRDFFPITATIWRNERTSAGWTKDGDKGPAVWYSATVERNYRDSQDHWKTADTFSGDELLVAAKLFDLAHTEISKLRAADRETRSDERSPGQEG